MNKAILLLVMAAALISWATIPCAAAQRAQPQLEILVTNHDPFPARAGEYMELFVKVQNTGSVEARNVTIELLDTYPFSLDPNEDRVKSYGTVKPTEPILAEYRVFVDEDARDGSNPIDIRLGTGTGTSLIRSFEILVESEQAEFAVGSLVTEPERLRSDTDDNKLTIEIQNIGEGAAKLLKAELDLPEGFEPSETYSDEYVVGTIEAESSGEAVFFLDIDRDVAAQEHRANLKLRYKDDNSDDYEMETLQVRIPVRASPSFEITGLVVRPGTLAQGTMGAELVMDIRNAGMKEADNVNVRVLKEATQPFEFDEKSDFVGDLGPGEAGQAVFHFDVDSTADLKKYILDIEIRYTEDSTVNLADDEISLEVTEPLPDPTGVYLLAIIMLVIIGGVIWYLRR